MDTLVSIFSELIRAFTTQGITGLILFVLLLSLFLMVLTAYAFYRSRANDLAVSIKEYQLDKQCLVQLVQNNTQAICESTAMIKHCALLVDHNQQLLQRLVDRLIYGRSI
jgi:hypothetical protein